MQIPDNKNAELVPGLTIDFKKARPGEEFSLSVKEDKEAVGNKISEFIQKINGVLGFINKQNKLDATSDTSRTLGGDTALFTIESRLRTLMFQTFNVASDPEEDDPVYLRLSDVGIQFEKTGLLSFKEDKFKKMVTENFDNIGNLFTGEGNLIERLKDVTEGFLRPETGAVTVREKGIKDRIRAMDNDIVNKERNLDRRETQLKRQFSQLEGLIQNMQGQQQYFQQAIGSAGLIQGG
jgi:flagellar hook-associated protein 2